MPGGGLWPGRGLGGIGRGGRCTPGRGAGRGGRCIPGRGPRRGGMGRGPIAGPLPGPGPPRLGGGPGFAIAADASMSSASIADMSFFIFFAPFSILSVSCRFIVFRRARAAGCRFTPVRLWPRRVSSARRARSFSPRGFRRRSRRASGSMRGSRLSRRALCRRAS